VTAPDDRSGGHGGEDGGGRGGGSGGGRGGGGGGGGSGGGGGRGGGAAGGDAGDLIDVLRTTDLTLLAVVKTALGFAEGDSLLGWIYVGTPGADRPPRPVRPAPEGFRRDWTPAA